MSVRTTLKSHRFSFGDCCIAIEERERHRAEWAMHSLSGAPSRVLLFLHGRYGHAGMWEQLLKSLDPEYRCFFLDLPGFGRSFSVRERGLSFLEQVSLVRSCVVRFTNPEDQVILVGHDIGGALAQVCAVSLPEEVRKRVHALILMNCAAFAGPVRGMKTGWFGLSARWRISQLLSRASGLLPEQRWQLLRPWLDRRSRSSLVRAFRAIESSWPGPFERQTWKKEIRNLDVPVLLLWGGKDSLNPVLRGMEMIQELQDASFFEHSGSGHWLPLEQPDWVCSKIQEFLFRLPLRKAA